MITFKKAFVLVTGGAAMMLAGTGAAHAGADIDGAQVNSAGGNFTGNLVEHATHVQSNDCGRSESYGSFFNPVFGAVCGNVNDNG